jgi:threonine dehydrogenase-like Zn-dependent dehydrogenase
LSFSDGAFIACAGGTAYSAMQKLEVSGNDCVAIFGLGPVGLSGLLVAKAMGGKVIGIDISSDRLALAQRLGADAVANPAAGDALETIRQFSGGEGVDLAFEASGSTQGRQQIVASLRRGGKAVFAGVGSGEKTLNFTEIIGRQLTLMGTFVLPLWMAWELVQFLRRHQISFTPVATHFFPIEQAPEAYRLADEAKTGKVVFMWE